MGIKLALLDVDGTLRCRDQWKPKALDLIEYLQARSIQVALCSGRPTGSIIELIERDLPHVNFFASSSGSTVFRRRDTNWELLAHRCLSDTVVTGAMNHAAHTKLEAWAYTSHQWLVPEITPAVLEEAAFIHDEPVVADISGRTDLGKVLFLLREPENFSLLNALHQAQGAAVVLSSSTYADLVPKEATQTKGGDVLLNELHLGWQDVLAIGDGENDQGMLSAAELAISVAPLKADQIARDKTQTPVLSAHGTAEVFQLVKHLSI